MEKVFVHEVTQKNLVGVYSETLRSELMSLVNLSPKLLILDCSKVEMIDSTCLGILILVSRIVNDRSQICLAGVDGLLKKVYHLSQMDQLLALFSSVDDALSSFAPNREFREESVIPIYTRSMALSADCE